MDREPAKWKREYVGNLTDIIKSSPVVGVVNISGIPAPQLQKMRNELRGKLALLVAKNNLLLLALRDMEKDKKGVSELCDLIDGQSALVGTTDNPFKLNKIMEATMTPAPAKGGELAPEDIDITAGETPFKPGPIVGDLQKAGIPAAIEGGKVMIKKSKTLVKAGEPIPADMAKMLTKLDIFPLTVGMDLRGAYEEGTVFGGDVLTIDDEKFMGDFLGAVSGSFNLACNIGYTTSATINVLLSKAHSDAFNVAMFVGVTNKETVELLISKAGGEMMALASRVPDALDDELTSLIGGAPAPAAEAPVEEKKEPVEDGEAKPEEKTEEKDEKPKKEKTDADEEEMAAGLGTLFEDQD
jgi:large subunit ribosomal protein L10